MPIFQNLPLKVISGGGTDTSKDTVTADAMLEGTTAHDAYGKQIVGTIATYDFAVSGGLAITNKLIGYSYNGIVLPALPEWDKETYPYASIFYNGTDYILYVTEGKIAQTCFWYHTVYTQLNYSGFYCNEFICTEDLQWNKTEDTWNAYYGYDEDVTLIWADYDVMDYCDDGRGMVDEPLGTYMYASSPVPFYE